jgi:ketosteroid isomerase-like protein
MACILLFAAVLAAIQVVPPSEELAQIQQRLMRAWVERDRAYIDSVLAADWTTTDPSGHVLTKADIMRQAFESDDRRVESGTIDDVRVRLFGDTAVVTGRTMAVGSYKGARGAATLRFTDVFVKRDGRWQAVASQGTLIAPARSTP